MVSKRQIVIRYFQTLFQKSMVLYAANIPPLWPFSLGELLDLKGELLCKGARLETSKSDFSV